MLLLGLIFCQSNYVILAKMVKRYVFVSNAHHVHFTYPKQVGTHVSALVHHLKLVLDG